MRHASLFKQRKIWVPTLTGAALALIILIAALGLVGTNIHSFLSTNQPSGAHLLVVEGWIPPDELDQAIAVFRRGNYTSAITTGGPVTAVPCPHDSAPYAELARGYLVRHGLPAAAVIAVPAPASAQERTYLSAVMVRLWLAQTKQTINAVDVFSAGVHSRRSRAVYRLAFGPDVSIGILASQPTDYDPAAWWRTSTGAKTVITELISWIWTELFFRPGPQGSHEEKWGRAPPVQSAK